MPWSCQRSWQRRQPPGCLPEICNRDGQEFIDQMHQLTVGVDLGRMPAGSGKPTSSKMYGLFITIINILGI
jgi:hypothetical protein